MHEDDTVAILVGEGEVGADLVLLDGRRMQITLCDEIRYGHKVAIKAMRAGDPVIKYGERMGIATADIDLGMHVHEHNVRGLNSDERRVSLDAVV